MTRFARAKGSKASNLKSPEDSTPWEVMKEQIIQSKKDSEEEKLRKEAEKQRIDNYSNFLKERKVEKRKSTWCEFPEGDSKKKPSVSTGQSSEAIHKKKKKNSENSFNSQRFNNSSNNESEPVTIESSEVSEKIKKRKKQNKVLNKDRSLSQNEVNNQVDNSAENDTQNISSQQAQNCNIQKKKKKKKNKLIGNSNNNKFNEADKIVCEVDSSTDTNMKNISSMPTQNDDVPKNKNKKKKLSPSSVNNLEKEDDVEAQNNKGAEENQNNNVQKPKKAKNKDQKPIRRKIVNDKSFQLIINGKEVELVRYDGFPIMKKDAERLEELKNSMIKKGIPKSEVQRTMKLERRRAEKALARIKRDVCYNCRKGGHNLSDCPDLKSKIPGVDGAEGVCFKCGSTEHRQFECKVQRDKEFRFATCFICKEAGHIARQCPDNPKGLYPNGGCCKLCGDVTHLKKDCPSTKDKKEETSIKLQTLDGSDNIEDISQKIQNTGRDGAMKKPKKIKF